MTESEFKVKLAGIFNVAPDILADSARPGEVPGWDSMASLDIISMLDDCGARDISAEDAAGFKTIGDVVAFAKAKGIVG